MASDPSSQRVGFPTDLDEKTKDVLFATPLHDGQPLNIFNVLANRPTMFRRYSALGGVLLFRSSLDARVRELVVLRVARNSRCHYEYSHHYPLAERAGITPAEIAAVVDISDEGVAHDWSDQDRALIEFVDELCEISTASDETYQAVARHFADPELVELVVFTGFYLMTALVNNTFHIEIEPHITTNRQLPE